MSFFSFNLKVNEEIHPSSLKPVRHLLEKKKSFIEEKEVQWTHWDGEIPMKHLGKPHIQCHLLAQKSWAKLKQPAAHARDVELWIILSGLHHTLSLQKKDNGDSSVSRKLWIYVSLFIDAARSKKYTAS